MDKTNPDSWFIHEFNPYSAVADYANEPPRGMTNAPMNLPLRKILCQDLCEYGLKLEVPHWGASFGRGASPSSAPTSPGRLQPQKLTRVEPARSQLMHKYTEKLRSGQILKSGSIFSKSAPRLIMGGPEDEIAPAHPDWHQYHPFQSTLRPITPAAVSLLKTPSAAERAAQEKRTVRFAEDNTKSLSDYVNKGPSPMNTEFIKTPSHTKAVTLGQSMKLDSSGKRAPEAPAMVKKSKDSGKDGAKDEDGKKKRPDGQVVDNKELDNRMRSLRGMSQLHRATVANQARFGASAAAGEPLVLRASTMNQANPGLWASDVSFLNKFHNSAVRIMTPSGMEVLKEQTNSRKKKKKKTEDESHLKMSDSGLFVARYPIDEALVKIRKIKKRAFPESDFDKTPVGPTPAENQAAAAAKLRLDLGGFLLSRVRDTEADRDEQAKALKASGYDKEARRSAMLLNH